jgi:hypothetical protein
MTDSKDGLKDRLARYRQIKISVVGRKSGRTISIPGVVRAGRREALPTTSAGFGHPRPTRRGGCVRNG